MQQKTKARPRKQRIKAFLKKVTAQHNREITAAIYLLSDLLQDGLIDGSPLFSLFDTGGL